MTMETKTIARNTSWFTLALILQKIIAFVYFTFLARILGAEDIGQYVFALSYMQIFSILIDFGTNHYITREVAKDKKNVKQIVANVFGFKLLSSVVAVVIALLAAVVLDYSEATKQLLYVAAGVMVIESFIISTYAIIRGFHTLKYESVATVISHVILATIGLIVANVTDSVMYLLLVIVLAYVLNLIFGLSILRYQLSVPIQFKFEFVYWKKIFAVVLPFALAAGFSKIYNAFDQVALSKLASEAALGFYAVAYKLTFALQFLPLALMAAVYPAMSKYYKSNNHTFNKLFTRAVFYLVLISFPISASVIVFARPLITALYTTEYAAAILPLQILIASIPLLFLNFPLGSLLNATDRQRRQTINMGIALVLNIALNLFFIPRLEAVGAALASSISTLLLFTLGVAAARTVVRVDKYYMSMFILKSLVATVVMAGVGWWLREHIYWFIALVLSGIAYIGMQVGLGTFNKQEFKQFLHSFKTSSHE